MNERVLVIDDDCSVRRSLEKVLVEAGYQVLLAASGQEALSRWASSKIDLLIFDLNLPLAHGWDAFEQLARSQPSLPVIALTGPGHRPSPISSAHVGAVLEKPLDVTSLLETIRRLLQSHRRGCAVPVARPAAEAQREAASSEVFLQSLRERATTPYHFELPRTRWPGLSA